MLWSIREKRSGGCLYVDFLCETHFTAFSIMDTFSSIDRANYRFIIKQTADGKRQKNPT